MEREWDNDWSAGSTRFAPTGRSWQVDGAGFHEYREGLISRVSLAFNLAQTSTQLGLLPPRGSGLERIAVALQRAAVRFRRR